MRQFIPLALGLAFAYGALCPSLANQVRAGLPALTVPALTVPALSLPSAPGPLPQIAGLQRQVRDHDRDVDVVLDQIRALPGGS